MTDFLKAFLPAVFGAAFQELLYWYDLRSKLDSAEYANMLKAPAYWGVTILMVFGSAYGTTVWFAGQNVGPKDFMIVSAAFPLLFKHAVSATSRQAKLGAADVLRNYFRMQ